MRKKFDLKTFIQLDIKDMGAYLKGENPIAPTKAPKKPKKRTELKQELVVFDLGSTMIHVVVGRVVKDQITIKHAFHFPMPIGCVDDGKILNEKRLAETLSDALVQRKIKAKTAIVSMNSSQIINRDLFIPDVEGDEMETVIRYELQQYLPINLDDYEVRFLLSDESNDETGKRRVFVSAYPERMLRSYYQMLQQADLHPYGLELPLVATRKLISQAMDVSQETVAFLDLGHESINISVYHLGNIDFTRLIRSGGRLIDEALRREGLKNEELLQFKQEQLDFSQADSMEQHPDVKQNVDQMVNEIEKFLQFYRNNNQSKPIETVFIYGGFAQITGLATYISEAIKIPTQLVNELPQLELAAFDKQVDQLPSYINAISSLIRGEE